MSQLHNDLQAIRESRKMSIQDVYDKTRLALENIEQIEDGTVFQSERNQTYTRSFVRTYARGIGLNDEHVIKALDLHETGAYDGSLRKIYLKGDAGADVSAKDTPSGTAKPDSSADSVEIASPPPKKFKTSEEQPPSPGKVKEPDPTVSEPSTGTKETKKRPKVLDGSSIGPGKTGPVKIGGPHVKPPPKTGDINWSDLGSRSSSSSKLPVVPIIAGAAVLILLVALLIWLLRPGTDAVETPVVPEEPVATETAPERDAPALGDTLDAPVPPDPGEAMNRVIPDTLNVVIYAATGNLEPFRVRSDTFENRRPYWVEQGVGMRITFVDEIHISGAMTRMLVLYDDRVITEFDEINEQGERILRRSQFEADPSLESFTSPDLPQGVPSPREVLDRPVIN